MPPLGAGLAFLPMALTIMACAMRAGALTARYGVRLRARVRAEHDGNRHGAVLCAGKSQRQLQRPTVLLPGLLVAIGVGFSVVPSTIAATAGAKPNEAGLASGLVNTSRQMGGALGLAILASLGAQYTSHLINSDFQAPLLALTNGFRIGYLLGAVFVAIAAIVTFVFVPKLPSASAATAGQAGETSATARQAGEAPATAGQAGGAPAAAAPTPDPAPVPAGANGSAPEVPGGPPLAPPPPTSPRARVTSVVFSLTGEGSWPVAVGSMTIQVAAGGHQRARREH